MEEEFKFNHLTKRQLLKLCISYNLKIEGSIPDNSNSLDELIELVESNLKVLDDGTIVKKGDKKYPKEVKVSGSGLVKITII